MGPQMMPNFASTVSFLLMCELFASFRLPRSALNMMVVYVGEVENAITKSR